MLSKEQFTVRESPSETVTWPSVWVTDPALFLPEKNNKSSDCLEHDLGLYPLEKILVKDFQHKGKKDFKLFVPFYLPNIKNSIITDPREEFILRVSGVLGS